MAEMNATILEQLIKETDKKQLELIHYVGTKQVEVIKNLFTKMAEKQPVTINDIEMIKNVFLLQTEAARNERRERDDQLNILKAIVQQQLQQQQARAVDNNPPEASETA